MEILGVRVDNLSRKEILEKIESFLSEKSFHQIATINPEFILEAQKNAEFKQILHTSDLNVADGFGIKLAFLRWGKRLKCRFAGVDLMHEILKIAERKNLGVFLAINKDGLSSFSEIREPLVKLYPDLKIDGANLDPKVISQMSNVTCNCIILCNYGAPNQEIFLNSQKNVKIRLVMGVGGSFDFLTGKTKRAPVWMRKIGLEWLLRLFVQPKRIKRIFKAVVVFPIKIIFSKNV